MYLYGPAENDYKQDGVHFESSSKTGQKHVAFVLKRVRVSNPQRLTYTQILIQYHLVAPWTTFIDFLGLFWCLCLIFFLCVRACVWILFQDDCR